jgi:hypothetical protein
MTNVNFPLIIELTDDSSELLGEKLNEWHLDGNFTGLKGQKNEYLSKIGIIIDGSA